MLKAIGFGLAAVLSLVLVSALPAQDKEKDKEKPAPREGRHGPGGMGMRDGLERILNRLDLTDEQQTKFKALRKEYGSKRRAAFEKFSDSLTTEQKEARQKAVEAGREAHKSPKETMEAVDAAMKLTDKQKEARKAMETLQKEFREKAIALLTPEQKEKLEKFEKMMQSRGRGEGKHEGTHEGRKAKVD
jgi:Spy/CpxP family protein refolding chaperone